MKIKTTRNRMDTTRTEDFQVINKTLPQGWEPITTAPTGVFITVVDDIRYANTPFSRYSAISDGTTWKDVHGAEKTPGYWEAQEPSPKPLVNLQFYPGDIVEIQSNDKDIDEDDNFCLYVRVNYVEVGMSFHPDYYFEDISSPAIFNIFDATRFRLFWSSFHEALAIDCHEWEQVKLIKAQIRKIERP